MKIKPKVTSSVAASPQIHALGGQFTFGGVKIPYFTAHLTLSQVRDSLKTPNELAAWTHEDEELESLYQRSIDYKRVEKSILPYLNDNTGRSPKFFNSLTVALVPRKHNSFVDYDSGDLEAPGLEPESGEADSFNVGPITIGTYQEFDSDNPDTYSISMLRWNKDEVACVAIDGQHRLHAIKRISDMDDEAGRNTRISVIFILPAAELGYQAPESTGGSIVKLLRSIFIDLNKHAVPVKRARLILLDDKDPHSLIVRRLIENKLSNVSYPVLLKEHRLPLGCIDWHGEEIKLDQGPYITTVLMLNRILELILGAKGVKDWTEKGKIKSQFEAFKRFGYEPSDECNAELQAFIGSEEEWQTPFSYSDEELKSISESVGAEMAEVVATVLTQLKPYDEIIEIRHHNNMLLADFSSWYERYVVKDRTSEDNRDYLKTVDHIRSRKPAPNIKEWEEILENRLRVKKDSSLFFKVVFQAAIFHAIAELWNVHLPVFKTGSTPERGSKEHRMEWVGYVVDGLNRLVSHNEDLFNPRYAFEDDGNSCTFWLGSAISVDTLNMDFTGAGMIRCSRWLQLMTLTQCATSKLDEADIDIPEDYQTFREVLDVQDKSFARTMANDEKFLAHGVSNNLGAMARIIKAQDHQQADDETDKKYEKRITDLNEKEFITRSNHFYTNLLA
jgi:DGQHR domain-containing protein